MLLYLLCAINVLLIVAGQTKTKGKIFATVAEKKNATNKGSDQYHVMSCVLFFFC